MSEGSVYVLTNPCYNGLIKIGRSINGGEERAKQLNTTGVPQPFQCIGEVKTTDCKRLERAVHVEFQNCRENNRKEFFRMSPHKALKFIKNEAKKIKNEKAIYLIKRKIVEINEKRGIDLDAYNYCERFYTISDEWKADKALLEKMGQQERSRNAHYSVLEARYGKGYSENKFVENYMSERFVIIWNVNHDIRIIPLVKAFSQYGWMRNVKLIGEDEGIIYVWATSTTKGQQEVMTSLCDSVIGAHYHQTSENAYDYVTSYPMCLQLIDINSPAEMREGCYSAKYINSILALWNLGSTFHSQEWQD